MVTRNMAPELAPKVRINAIEVGGVETDALASVLTDDSVRRQLEENTPMRRVGQVEDIAAGVVYLASDAVLVGHRARSSRSTAASSTRRSPIPVEPL